ncbi:hypothetical protein P9112_012101 [Eukaryota sp. TZLM1-RC]
MQLLISASRALKLQCLESPDETGEMSGLLSTLTDIYQTKDDLPLHVQCTTYKKSFTEKLTAFTLQLRHLSEQLAVRNTENENLYEENASLQKALDRRNQELENLRDLLCDYEKETNKLRYELSLQRQMQEENLMEIQNLKFKVQSLDVACVKYEDQLSKTKCQGKRKVKPNL